MRKRCENHLSVSVDEKSSNEKQEELTAWVNELGFTEVITACRDLVVSSMSREILKLENWNAEQSLFRARCEAKT